MNKILSILLACSMVLPYTNFLAFANEDEVILTEEPLTVEQEAIDIEVEKELPVAEIQEEPETVSGNDTLDKSPYSGKYGKLIADGSGWSIYNDGTMTINAGWMPSSIRKTWSEYSNYVERIIIEPVNGCEYLILPPDSSYFFSSFRFLEFIDTAHMDTRNVTNMYQMFSNCSSLTNLDLSSFDTSNVTDMALMFNGCSSLISVDLSNFDTSNVSKMYALFQNCSSLKNLNISGFNTSKVKDLSGMFYNCSSLEYLDLSSFDTSEATTMCAVFYNCSSLTTLDLSRFNTENVKNMSELFYGCKSLKELNLSSFDTTLVTNMEGFFAFCSSLTSLDLSMLDTNNVMYMGDMFLGCSSLTNLNLSNLNTRRVSDMSYMFSGCSSLTTLDLSQFDTSKVTDMSAMFSNCSSLTNLDLSGFNISKVKTMYDLFSYCSSLVNLDISSFDTSNNPNMMWMFDECNSLPWIKFGPDYFNGAQAGSNFPFFWSTRWVQEQNRTNQKTWTQMAESWTSSDIGWWYREVKLSLNIGSGSEDVSFYFEPGTVIDLTEYNPKKEGYSFIGWFLDYELQTPVEEIVLKDNTTVYAGWEEKKNSFNFVDVPPVMWYHDIVYETAQAGLMTGLNENEFAPNAHMTRGMVATVIYRMAGSPEVYGKSGFKDVKDNMFYTDAVTWAVQNGVVTGYATGDKAGQFGPNDNVTREQLCTMVYRYLTNVAGKDTSARADLSKFWDPEMVSPYALDAVKYCVAVGIISGANYGTLLNPVNLASRAECAKILLNASKI